MIRIVMSGCGVLCAALPCCCVVLHFVLCCVVILNCCCVSRLLDGVLSG